MKKYLLTLGTLVLVLALHLSFASSVFAASMSLSPATLSRYINDEFSVDIVVDPEGQDSSGATAIINYDKDKLQAETVTAGTSFTQELENSIDPTLGQIRYDAGVLGSTVNTRSTLATIKFKAITAGVAAVNIVFDPNSTTNTSIVAAASGPTNLLTDGNVNNGSYTISATGSGTTRNTGTLPGTGAVEDTLMVLGGGSLLLVLGGFLARKTLLGV
jgi:LPXTG-motif cell wall-anchored protein